MIFNFEDQSKKGLKELEIIEMPDHSKFMDYKTKSVVNKIINVPRTGIYKFRFYNSAMGKRVCRIRIQRIPAKEQTRSFNSSVYWRQVQDTIFNPVRENFLVRSDTSIKEILSAMPQISSNSAFNGNKPYQIIDFMLPEHTISWSFYLACGNKGKEEYERTRAKFARSAAAVVSDIPGYGVLGALALTGLSYFSSIQGEDNVKYWFLSDASSAEQFQAGFPAPYYKAGDVISEAAQMKQPLNGRVFLALKNDNSFEPITLTLKVVAVTVDQQWDSRIIQKMTINTRQEAYLEN